MIKIFIGGGGGGSRGSGWGGGSSERCLKWVGEVIKRSFQKHLKTGVGKGKSCSQGEKVLKVSPDNRTLCEFVLKHEFTFQIPALEIFPKTYYQNVTLIKINIKPSPGSEAIGAPKRKEGLLN